MKNSSCVVMLIVLCTLSVPSLSATCDDVSGTWRNALGSTLTVNKIEKGVMSGSFQLSPKIDSFQYTVVGVVNTKAKSEERSNVTAVSFSVHWDFLGSVGNWVGVCRGSKSNSKLELIGHQVVPNAGQVNEHVYTHQDVFYPSTAS
ncbi:MAG: hypothetical protein ACI93R_001286 [Flavobacteriales bacterium]